MLRRAGEVRAAAFRPIGVADLTTARQTASAEAAPATAPSTDATVWVRRATELTQYSVPTRNGGPSRRVPEPVMPPQSSASGPFAAAGPLTSAPAPGEPQ